MNKTLVAIGFAVAAGLVTRAAAAADRNDETDQAAKALAENVCAVCHGPGGRSTYAATPNLAAQTRAYLAAKITQFRERALSRADTHVDVLGLTLADEAMTDALARYFAAQPAATPVAGDTERIAAGAKIFARGNSEQNLAPCGVCHGADAHGMWIFPRLAGQHADYVVRQLELIQQHLRNAPVMHGVIKSMTPQEIKEVAAFLQAK